MTCYLGIDVGTQSVKALCFDAETRRVLATTSAPLDLVSREDGTREQEARWWISALHSCLAQLAPDVKASVAAIGVSGQQHGFVPLAANGEVLAPVKLWCDTVTGPQCEQIMSALGGVEHCIREVGNPILPGYTASKILWLKQHHPDVYQQLNTILLPHDYLNYYLTGKLVMECGDASGTGLLDIRERRWHAGILRALDAQRDLSACLPGLVNAGDFIGELRNGVARELGLPVGTPVSCGGGDNMMAAIGTGTVAPGRLAVSLGTSGTLFAYADQPVVDDTGTLAAFCDSTGGWLPLLCTMNCTVATELTRNMLGVSLEQLAECVAGAPVGSEGVITLPFFQGERMPNLPNGRGCVHGLNHGNYTPANLLRSAMESAVYGLRAGLDIFRRGGCDISSVRVTGGGAKSAVWRQMVADIFALPVFVQKVDEGAALGAALQACWVHRKSQGDDLTIAELVDAALELDDSRTCEPCLENTVSYAKHYQRYLQHVEAIFPLYSNGTHTG